MAGGVIGVAALPYANDSGTVMLAAMTAATIASPLPVGAPLVQVPFTGDQAQLCHLAFDLGDDTGRLGNESATCAPVARRHVGCGELGCGELGCGRRAPNGTRSREEYGGRVEWRESRTAGEQS